MANTIPAGVICAWPGTAASIPTGWQRVTALSSLHTRGAAASVNPGAAGGATTHGHQSNPHDHGAGTSHVHAGGSSLGPLGPIGTVTATGATPTVAYADWPTGHLHTFPTAPPAANSASSAAPAWTIITAEQPYFGVIWIRSDGTPTGFPVGSVGYWPTSSVPSGWGQHAPSAGRYLKGADTSADGGATGGVATHGHSTVAHTHSTGNHAHPVNQPTTNPTTSVGTATVTGANETGAGIVTAYANPPAHTHGVVQLTADASTGHGQTTSTTSADAGAAAMDPPYTVCVAIENTGAGPDRPEGMVVLWTGTLAGIPFGWRLCDGTNGTPDLRQQFIRAATTPAEAGATGGAVGHTHAGPATHTHSDTGHSHAAQESPGGIVALSILSGATQVPPSLADGVQGHPLPYGPASVNQGTGPATAQPIASATDSRPPFVDIAFLAAPGLLTVTITAPGNPVTTNNPTVTWTISGGHTQQSYTLTLYAADGVTVLYTSGLVTSATQSAVIPAGHLHQGLTYIIDVQSFTTDFFLGDGTLTTVAAFSPSPTVTGVTATPEPSDIPPSVLVQWTQGTLSAGQTFVQTNIERRVLGTTPWQQVGTVTPITTVSFRDYTAASGVTYEYAVTTTTNYGGDILRSAEQSPAPQATLTFLGIWLHIFATPGVYLNYPANAGSLNRIQDQVNVPTWGRSIPTTHIGQQYWRTWTFSGIPIVYPGLPGAPGLASAGTQDPWKQIDAFGLAAQQAGENGIIVVRFGSMQETGFGVVDFGSANQSAGSSGGQTGRKDELGTYTPTLVIDEQFIDTSV